MDSNAVDFVSEGINFVGRTFDNNGIQGKIALQGFSPNEPYTITATVIGNYKYVKYQKEPYYCSQNINKLTPRRIFTTWNDKVAYFCATSIYKFVSQYDGQQGGYKLTDIKKHKIYLPMCKDKNIDFAFMENFIAELEAERLAELEAYLEAAGLKDTELTEAEEKAWQAVQDENMKWGEFKLGSLFTKLDLRSNLDKLDKKYDVSTVQNEEFSLPLVNAKDGNNGIMFYGRDADWDSAEMTIDIVANGAVATGNVYPQPHKTGVMWDAYLIKPNFLANAELLQFFSTTIYKTIKPKFSYEYKAVWNRVSQESILLPVTDSGEIDFAFMENFISAVQKQVVRGVAEYSERKMAAYREVVGTYA